MREGWQPSLPTFSVALELCSSDDQFEGLLMMTPRKESVADNRGAPKALLAATEPDVLTLLGEESQRKGTDKLPSGKIDRLIKIVRAERRRCR